VSESSYCIGVNLSAGLHEYMQDSATEIVCIENTVLMKTFIPEITLSETEQDVLVITNGLRAFDTTRTAQKMGPPTILRCCGNVFTELLPNSDRGMHRHTRLTVLLLMHLFGAAFTEPLLRNERRDTLTEPLPSNARGNTRMDT
jgi:hypothetical protein